MPNPGAVRGAVSSLQSKSKSKGKWQPLWQFFSSIGVRLYCGANASDSFENRGLLTEQALPLSEESLSRQQAFDPSCAMAFAACLLLHWRNWILQVNAGMFCQTPRLRSAIVVYVFCVPHSGQLKALSACCIHCQGPAAFSDTSHALQALSAPPSPYTGGLAG